MQNPNLVADGRWTLGSRRSWAAALLLVLLATLAFQGSRGLWEPDEGFYTNGALGMVRTGEWLLPRLNGELFLDKPPLVYWTIASGLAAVGSSEWGARLGHALWFVLTAFAVGRLGAAWWDEATGLVAMLVFAGTLLPPLAANFVTPDTILAAPVVLAWLCGWRWLRARGALERTLWGAALGAVTGIGFLAKGPAMAVFAAPLAVHLLLHGRPVAKLVAPVAAAAATLIAVALPWFALVVSTVPGSGDYLLDNQVMGRLVEDTYARNAEWYGGIKVYLPTLVIGALPWSLAWPVWLFRTRRTPLGERLRRLAASPVGSALALWLALPIVVFVLASSRLPLYVLPLFAPMALGAARALTTPAEGGPAWTHRRVARLAVASIVVLVAGKAILAGYPYRKDSRRLAEDLRAAGVDPSSFVVTVDVKANGLALYGYSELEWNTMMSSPYPFFTPIESLAEEMRELSEDSDPRYFVVSGNNRERLESTLAEHRVPHTARRLDRVPYWLIATPPLAAAKR